MTAAPQAPDTAVREDLRCPEPDVRPDLWPAGTRRDEQGMLVIGGVRVGDLAQYTPVYVWDTADFAGRAFVWRAAMEEAFWPGYGMAGARCYYAAKAFVSARAVRLVSEAGLGIDTASEGELAWALDAGADPALVGLHGNNKSDAALARAVSARIGRIIVDSAGEVDRLEAAARAAGRDDVPCMVRVTSGVHAGGHAFIATAHEDQKFGLSLSGDALAVIRRIAASPVLTFAGLHSHIGSQIFDLDAFREAATRLLALAADLAREGIGVSELDVGGGLGIAYTGADPLACSPKALADTLAEVVRTACAATGLPIPRVSVEPGRSIAGPSQVMLYTVGTVKAQPLGDGQERLYVAVDGGMSDNIRPALYGAAYTATLANRVSEAEGRRARVVGSHCESGDIVVHDVVLPGDIAPGDLLAVPAVGAYGHTMASNYNMMTRPGVVAVARGVAETVIAPETLGDLMRRDRDLADPT